MGTAQKRQSREQDVACHAVVVHRQTGKIVGPPTPVFKEDWPYSIPPPATRIWRYMDFRKLEDWLRTNAIRFTRCDKFKDHLDGRFSKGNEVMLSKSEAAFQAAYPIQHQTFEQRASGNEIIRGCTFISCWNIAPNEKPRMWQEYTGTPRAVAVVSSVKAIQRELPSSVEVSRVKYVPDDFPRSQLSHLSVYFYKSRELSYENELRLLRPMQEDETVSQDNPEDVARYVSVRLKKVIQEVVVHPDADSKVLEEIRICLEKALPAAIVRPSSLPRQGFCTNPKTLTSTSP